MVYRYWNRCFAFQNARRIVWTRWNGWKCVNESVFLSQFLTCASGIIPYDAFDDPEEWISNDVSLFFSALSSVFLRPIYWSQDLRNGLITPLPMGCRLTVTISRYQVHREVLTYSAPGYIRLLLFGNTSRWVFLNLFLIWFLEVCLRRYHTLHATQKTM